MNPFIQNQFGLQHLPGVGYVELKNANPAASLGDASSVMMISGLGGLGADVGISRSDGGPTIIVREWFKTVPWWVWVLIAIGAISAGAYIFRNMKKVK